MDKKKEKKNIKDFIPAVLVSLAASFMLMVFAPIEIYYSNQDQFWFEIKQLIPVVACLFVLLFIVSLIILGIMFLINTKVYNIGLAMYFIAFISSYIQGNFLVKNLPGLDGTQPVWKDYISEDIKTIVVWVVVSAVVIAFSIKFKPVIMRKAVSIVSVCMFLMIAVTMVTVVLTTKVADKDYEMVVTDKDEFEMSSDTNFIILLLDAMEGGTYNEVAQNHPEYAEIMKDFTYYDNTVCGYTFTKQSIPFILSGIWYENERPFEEYAADAYLKKLKENGVYDNSVIIVMADHGYGLSYGPRNRQHPVLFVKGKNESHDYTVSEAPISYDDLQEAFSRLLDGAMGEEVFDYKEGDERKRRYLYFEYEHEEILEEFYQEGYAGDLDTLKATGRKYIYSE